MKKIITVVFLLSLISLQSCYYDKEEYLYPNIDNTCETVNVTYSTTISGIIAGSCLSCHSNATAAGLGANIRLETYSDLKTYVDNGKFQGSVFHDSGYSPMPKNAAQLNDCKRQQITIWINNGALNN